MMLSRKFIRLVWSIWIYIYRNNCTSTRPLLLHIMFSRFRFICKPDEIFWKHLLICQKNDKCFPWRSLSSSNLDSIRYLWNLQVMLVCKNFYSVKLYWKTVVNSLAWTCIQRFQKNLDDVLRSIDLYYDMTLHNTI